MTSGREGRVYCTAHLALSPPKDQVVVQHVGAHVGGPGVPEVRDAHGDDEDGAPIKHYGER
jgi:hypothetical protein